jgi:cholesterol oxidase
MGTDAGDGRMFLEDGELDLAWSHAQSRAMFREMEDSMRKLAEAAGGTWSPSLLWRWPTRKLLTAHPLGGCVMGDAPATSVVNHACEVWNYPGLYVTDGAAIPSALAVNPSLTIAAVAERSAFWMLHGREK